MSTTLLFCTGLSFVTFSALFGLSYMFIQAEDGIRDLIVTGVQTCVFLQAEDGIRDLIVTGVQTCALPIFTWAVIITASAQLIFLFNFIWSLFKGERAGDNPWEATTLEWTTATPPPHDNFGGRVPVVYRGAYEYGVPGAPDDYVMQTTPDETEANVSSSGAHDGQGSGNGHDGHR